MRFIKHPGRGVLMAVDGKSILITQPDDTPDNVTLPPEICADGAIATVKGAITATCPAKECNNAYTRHLILEGGITVAECHRCGFIWYRKTTLQNHKGNN